MDDIIHLNVGGERFCTSKQTLTSIPDTFFTSLLSGRIATTKDENNAIFVDRDPKIFRHILNYLRTKEVHFGDVDFKALKHEAEFYGITPLFKKLVLCCDLESKCCGGVLFHAIIPAPGSNLLVNERRAYKNCCFVGLTLHNYPNNSMDRKLFSHSKNNLKNMSNQNVENDNQSANVFYHYPMQVTIIKGHLNWLLVAYPHFVTLYKLKDSVGWNLEWTSPNLECQIDMIALNAKNQGQEGCTRMVAIGHDTYIRLWTISDYAQNNREIGAFNLTVPVSALFFIGSHLVALSEEGKFGVWQSNTQNWQSQDVVSIKCHESVGSLLFLGCANGCIYVIDMQKFPLRMKDNDLLVTELFKDPNGESITALSIYLTPKSQQQFVGFGGNWMELAYGTSSGVVRILVQHPETLGTGPQLFQSFAVHCSSISKVGISEKNLISVCSEHNHVRTWSVIRFRGMINTQPGSTPLASFKIFRVDQCNPPPYYATGNDFGPFGEKDEVQLLIQKVVPFCERIFVRLASLGKRVCEIKSADGSLISSFGSHECDASGRIGSRPTRHLFTGHINGTVQVK